MHCFIAFFSFRFSAHSAFCCLIAASAFWALLPSVSIAFSAVAVVTCITPSINVVAAFVVTTTAVPTITTPWSSRDAVTVPRLNRYCVFFILFVGVVFVFLFTGESTLVHNYVTPKRPYLPLLEGYKTSPTRYHFWPLYVGNGASFWGAQPVNSINTRSSLMGVDALPMGSSKCYPHMPLPETGERGEQQGLRLFCSVSFC